MLSGAGLSNVHVYEREQRSSESQSGGVIGLGHVALGIFERLGIDQREFARFPSEWEITIKLVDRRETRRARSRFPGRNVRWGDLHRVLAACLPAGVLHEGERVTGIGTNGVDRAVLHRAGQPDVPADLIVFADGRRSIGRELLDPGRPVRYAGFVAHRGRLMRWPDGVRDFQHYVSPGTQFDTFPIELSDGRVGIEWALYQNMTAVGFRERFGADPTRRTFVPAAGVTDRVRAELDAVADELLPAQLAEWVRETAQRMAVPILDIDPLSFMTTNIGSTRAVLLGDALATPRPQTFAGANHGIAQAAGLANALGQHLKYGAHLATALTGVQRRHLREVHETLHSGIETCVRNGLGTSH